MLTEKDIKMLNASKSGEIVVLDDGRTIAVDEYDEGGCDGCALYCDNCGRVDCEVSNVVYRDVN